MENITIKINGVDVSAPAGSTILEAARLAHIDIPTLCYLKEINEIGACRICCVEVEGKEKLITSCNNMVEEGMIIYTNSPKVRRNRRTTSGTDPVAAQLRMRNLYPKRQLQSAESGK